MVQVNQKKKKKMYLRSYIKTTDAEDKRCDHKNRIKPMWEA